MASICIGAEQQAPAFFVSCLGNYWAFMVKKWFTALGGIAANDEGGRRGWAHEGKAGVKDPRVWISALALCGAGVGLAGAVAAGVVPGAGGLAAVLGRPAVRYHSLTVPIPPAMAGDGLPPVAGPGDRSRPLIVIDPGHGGRDPGAEGAEGADGGGAAGAGGGRPREKDVTLALALALRDDLLRGGRVRVALTRADDRTLSLEERADMARKLGADLFVSLHADAADNPEAQGATIYTLSETASDREAERLAARENRDAMVNGVAVGEQDGAVSSILIDLSRREAMKQSADFARLLYREASPTVRFRPIPHRFASLIVLKAPDVPSVLFEAGYITSAADAAQLAAPEGRERIAQGIARAVAVYFARRPAA